MPAVLTVTPDLDKLRRQRIFKFRTQEAMAKRIGSSQSWVSEIESGRKQPSFAIMCDIADALECDVRELLVA
jgi:transcriptional regulator with XRE-family HTH domain